MNNLLKKSLVALCIMTSSGVTTHAGIWSDPFTYFSKKTNKVVESEKINLKNVISSEDANQISDLTKDIKVKTAELASDYAKKTAKSIISTVSINSVGNICKDATNFVKANWGNKKAIVADEIKNLVSVGENLVGSALKNIVIPSISDNKDRLVQMGEIGLNGVKEGAKIVAQYPFNSGAFFANILSKIFGVDQIISDIIDEKTKPEKINKLTTDAVNFAQKKVGDLSYYLLNGKPLRISSEYEITTGSDDDFVFVTGVNPYKFTSVKNSDLEQSFLEVTENESSSNTEKMIIPGKMEHIPLISKTVLEAEEEISKEEVLNRSAAAA